MRASLADQTGGGATPSLAIALGANLPSRCGNPIATLIAVRPLLEASVRGWSQDLRRPGETTAFRWSPLFETQAVGGPPGQPNYVNAVVLVEGASVTADAAPEATADAAEDLLGHLQELEQHFGRERQERWGPRSLDLDLLWWGDLRCHTPRLQLPHPRWQERDFVLAPLAALGAALEATAPGPNCTAVALAGQPGWPEQLGAAWLTRTDEPPAEADPRPG
ncbi:2-amino-4-hydroxy-6-hydroxymethyldihydropteridine diphosphokinase [Cyanobium sp. ATX 6E8]|uniref:2-amino-4-hydroxy-6- hydroxymethyldihydropteridine diphosphokinase n=1 Tax=Cyanobium sp. ATX 6E8 TaxID=2823701 RepID=UPI0020CDAFF2|nr:2-amino-4-hydroxy-6-hydroxymethyldihydropteridine diphosphokinase [Cyanobium sp. ATX 6E8]MCP9942286.1 2-amino-4-hydroxy-6-hydroxymethyldihydropteridine diphosphokinase [Cyanobium sp. ATX 6E8]